ncbi:MAG: hypothetical protein WBJ13_01830, partial [Sedimentibacter sp.]
HILLSDCNGGYGYGNNLGIRYSCDKLNADYTLIANPDVIFSNECVYKLRQVLVDNKDCAISAAIPLKPSGEKQKVIAWKLPTIKEEVLSASIIFSKLFGSSSSYNEDYYKDKENCYVDVVQGAMLMLDTKLMIKYGMYDEDFFLYGEEQVLAKRINQEGYKSVLLLNEYYVHNHSVSINKSYKSLVKKKELMFESKLLYLRKYEGLKGISYNLTFVFYKLALLEAWIISIIRKIQKRRIGIL